MEVHKKVKSTGSRSGEPKVVKAESTSGRSADASAGFILAFLSAAGFSGLGIFAKLLYGSGFSVVQTLAWRFTLACLFLLPVITIRSHKHAGARSTAEVRKSDAVDRLSAFLLLPRATLIPVVLLGILGYSTQAGMFFLTVRILDPGMASLLLYLYPSFVLLLTAFLWKLRPSRMQILALVLSLIGCALTFFKAGRYPVPGLLLAVSVAFAYGLYLVAGERILRGLDSMGATVLITAVTACVYWTAVAISGIPPRGPDSWQSLAGFIGVSLISTAFPMITLFRSMEKIGVANASLVCTVEPVFTLLLSLLFFGETPGPMHIIGGALILASVVVLRFAAQSSRAAVGRKRVARGASSPGS